MKKKYSVPSKDKKDWMDFVKDIGDITPKESDLLHNNLIRNKIPKLDLHGFSLSESNHAVEKFINKSFDGGLKKILIVTGKGSRSKSYNDPYISNKLGILKFSVPEFIKNNENLKNIVVSITKAQVKDGGEGAIYVFLKNNKNL